MRKPMTFEIEIGIDKYGNPTCSSSTLKAMPKDKIVWYSTLGPFTVTFLDASPFSAFSLHSEYKAVEERNCTEEMPVRDVLGRHRYSFAVVKASERSTMVLQEAGCPEIVVSNDGN